jgi:MoxR-like ATPase
VSLFLALRLGRPLFLEGQAGVGKTALASDRQRRDPI